MNRSNFLSMKALLLVLSALGGVSGFSSAPTMGASSMTMGLRVPFASKVFKSKSRFTSSTKNNQASQTTAFLSQQQEVILREFEKKEAKIQQRRDEAMAKLNAYEQTLNELQAKKSEYLAAAQVAEPPVGGSFSETAIRSAVKAFCWRIVAGSVTFVTTLKFSGSVAVALKVVGADFFSKAFTMFIGERLMNKSSAGRKAGSDDVGRSIAKALLWRLFAICNTLTMAVFVSKDLSIASKIASTDAVFKTALMFVYERIWARVQWGKEYLLEYSI